MGLETFGVAEPRGHRQHTVGAKFGGWLPPCGELLYVDPVGVGSCIPCGFPSLRGLPALRSSEPRWEPFQEALKRNGRSLAEHQPLLEYPTLRLSLPWVIRYPKLPSMCGEGHWPVSGGAFDTPVTTTSTPKIGRHSVL